MLATHPGGGRAGCRCWPSSPAGKGRTAVFTERHDAELAAGAESPRPGVALPAVLGPDDPLAGEPYSGGEGRGRHHGPDRQGLLRAGLADHRLGRRPQSRRARGPTRPRSSRRSRPPGHADAVTLAPIAGSAGSYQGTFEPKRPGTYEIAVQATDRRDCLTGRADDGRGRQAQPRVRPARPGRRRLLAKIAEATGGRYFHISSADQLIGRARPQGEAPARLARAAALLPRRLLGASSSASWRRSGCSAGGFNCDEQRPRISLPGPRGPGAGEEPLAGGPRAWSRGSSRGLHSSPYKGFSVEFAEHRKYSPGDNTRHLDWRILGRTDRLYIKQYEEETNLRAQILLDTSALDGLRRAPRDHQARSTPSYLTAVLCLPDDASAGRRGADDLRHRGPARYAGAELAAALRRDDEPSGGRSKPGARRRTWGRPSTAWPTGSSGGA